MTAGGAPLKNKSLNSLERNSFLKGNLKAFLKGSQMPHSDVPVDAQRKTGLGIKFIQQVDVHNQTLNVCEVDYSQQKF